MQQSLADLLGTVPAPATHAAHVLELPPLRASHQTVRMFALSILNAAGYRESLLRRILLDALPSAVECLLYHYAYGKPVERVEVKDVTDPIGDFTAEQCEARALRLLEVARQLRARQSGGEGEPQ